MAYFSALLFVVLWLAPIMPGDAAAQGLPPSEKRTIEALIASVEQLTDAVFKRNGKGYKAAAAAEFLRRKWRLLGSEIHSAEDFVSKVASVSSTTGRPYSIRFSDGREMTSAHYFGSLLANRQDSDLRPHMDRLEVTGLIRGTDTMVFSPQESGNPLLNSPKDAP